MLATAFMEDKEIYNRIQKPNYLKIYLYRLTPLLFLFSYIYFEFGKGGDKEYRNLLFYFDCFLIFLVILIYSLATRAVSEAVDQIVIHNTTGSIEVHYRKGLLHRRNLTESCEIRFVKYILITEYDKNGKEIDHTLSIEMPSGNFFQLRELRGFNVNDLWKIMTEGDLILKYLKRLFTISSSNEGCG